MSSALLEKRNKFYFPVKDNHFNGEEYQKPHRFHSLGFVDNYGTAIDVGAHVLDSFDFENVDYLKVDVEGFELQFLKGAAETIKRTKPVINIEIKNNCESFGISRQDIADYICKDLGMTCVGKTVQDYIFKYV